MSTSAASAKSDINITLNYAFNDKKESINIPLHYTIWYNATEWDADDGGQGVWITGLNYIILKSGGKEYYSELKLFLTKILEKHCKKDLIISDDINDYFTIEDREIEVKTGPGESDTIPEFYISVDETYNQEEVCYFYGGSVTGNVDDNNIIFICEKDNKEDKIIINKEELKNIFDSIIKVLNDMNEDADYN